jgi:AraC-like DNA-binding protein
MAEAVLHLYDPRNGDLALQVGPSSEEEVATPRRWNYFTILHVQQGRGTFHADLARHPFGPGSLLFSNPYQAIQIHAEEPIQGTRIQFHANFLCIETYHEEIGCNGVLFNDLFGVPLLRLDAGQEQEFGAVVANVRRELEQRGLAQAEALLAWLKILLIKASRLKLEQQALRPGVSERLPPLLDELKQLLEVHYRTRHRPADYADLLATSAPALARLVKTHLGKTLTELIRERILKQAKWELLHTREPVKRIALGLGFADELYFSRLFKKATGCSPTFFREYETAIRGGRNLSMSLSGPSIPPPVPPVYPENVGNGDARPAAPDTSSGRSRSRP